MTIERKRVEQKMPLLILHYVMAAFVFKFDLMPCL